MKATLLKIAAAAAGIIFALCIVAGAVLWYASRPKPPKPWNGIAFTFDVENTTPLDLTLPQHIIVMQESKSSHALHGSFLKLDHDYFIPAHHTMTVSLGNSNLCAPNFDPSGCFHAYFEEDQAIVLFDQQNRHEIHIEMPALTIPEFNEWKPEKTSNQRDKH